MLSAGQNINMSDSEARRPKRFLKIVVIAVFLGLLGWGFFTLARTVYVADQAERNLHCTTVVARMLESYVQENCRWPSSWDDLEPHRLLLVRRGDLWSRDAAQLVKRVEIQYRNIDGLPSDDDFRNQTPFRPRQQYYYVDHYEEELEFVRGAVARCR